MFLSIRKFGTNDQIMKVLLLHTQGIQVFAETWCGVESIIYYQLSIVAYICWNIYTMGKNCIYEWTTFYVIAMINVNSTNNNKTRHSKPTLLMLAKGSNMQTDWFEEQYKKRRLVVQRKVWCLSYIYTFPPCAHAILTGYVFRNSCVWLLQTQQQ